MNRPLNKTVFFLFLSVIMPPAAARVADCKNTNPGDARSVFNCTSSYRQGPAGKNIFENNIEMSDCRNLSKQYLKAMNISGVRFDAKDKEVLRALLPTCEIFSEITRRYTGDPSWWSSCLGRPGSPEHLKNCLTSTAKRYYNKPLGKMGGCEGLSKLYKKGLTAASNFIVWGNITLQPDYLAAFDNLHCDDYQAVLNEQAPVIAARWASCMNYDPDNIAAHLKACIGDEIKKLNTCKKVRSRYEQKISQAAGGFFPAGYVMLDCSLTEPLIAEEKKRVETERLAKLERRKARAEKIRREAHEKNIARQKTKTTAPPAPGKKGSGGDTEFSGSIIPGLILFIAVPIILILLWRRGLFLRGDYWTRSWQRISGPEDFANTAVYMKNGPNGPLFRISFKNKEFFIKGWQAFLSISIFVAALFAVFPALLFLSNIGLNGWVSFILVIAGLVLLFNTLKVPWTIKRIIEIDKGTDTFRVLNNGSLEIERHLSRLDNLTVEDHPDAQFERENRIQRGEKKLKHAEMSHCLVGWFGIKGSERVILITRAEWPNLNSLYEVRQAVIWAKELSDAAVMPDSSKPDGDGMKPPRD